MPVSNQLPRQFLNLRHIIGLLLVALITLGLPGCSAVKLGYQNAPELVYWWLDSYLDFNDTQSPRLRADLAALQSWHRQHELPLYISALERLQGLAPTNVSPAQVCGLVDEMRPRLQALLDQAAPTVVALAPTLTSAQLDHLARQFDKRNQKWREEWLDGTPTERDARRVKLLTERAENFYGRLEQTQLASLRASVAVSMFDASMNYRESQRRQRDMLQTLRQLQGVPRTGQSVNSDMRALMERSLRSPEPDHRNYADQLTQENCTTFAALHNSMTASQRRSLAEILKGYVSDARELMNLAR